MSILLLKGFVRKMPVEKNNQGFIFIPLLLVLLACAGITLSVTRNVIQETEILQETVRMKQLEKIAQSFMQTALLEEDPAGITEALYRLGPLVPGKDNATVRVTVNRESSLGLRFLQVRAEDSGNNGFSLRQCRIVFPADLVQQLILYSAALSAGQPVEGNPEGKDMSITSKSDGAVFPEFSAEGIAAWASTDFPSSLELQRDGLSGWIYFSREKVSLPKGLNVRGKGILMFADDAEFADNIVFTDRIVILADRNVHVGSHVRMEKALLLCRGKLTVGTDSFINGAVMARQGVKSEGNTIISLDREVLEPFDSIISY